MVVLPEFIQPVINKGIDTAAIAARVVIFIENLLIMDRRSFEIDL